MSLKEWLFLPLTHSITAYYQVLGSKEQSRFPSTLLLPWPPASNSPKDSHYATDTCIGANCYNLLTENIAISEGDRRKIIRYKDALVNLAEPNIPYRKKKLILVH